MNHRDQDTLYIVEAASNIFIHMIAGCKILNAMVDR